MSGPTVGPAIYGNYHHHVALWAVPAGHVQVIVICGQPRGTPSSLVCAAR